MLDIHTHILPGMDDGSQSVEQSLAMLEEEARQGVHTVVMTPHFLANREAPERFIQRRVQAEYTLKSCTAARRDLPVLLTGAEVAFFDGMCRAEALEQLCIEGTNAMLIEMPFCRWNRRMLAELDELRQLRGIQPILAHIERFMTYQPAGTVEKLIEDGMLIQINASFATRWQTSRQALSMLKREQIHFVASDCHNMDQRKPNLGEAMSKIERKLGAPAMEYLWTNQNMLLGG